ncbi:helix-turn-helix domain-containing protein [Ottowia sp.]|uniref:helix-turn-helix domain-containing protein n=1 Tax=Ottowia sp. TaxID=1898956 RepID=UPI003A85A28F
MTEREAEPVSATESATEDRAEQASIIQASATQAGSLTAGAMLRQMREAAEVDQALLASALKVSPQKIQALESDQFDQLPDMTFARGLASAVARAFGADPAPVLERMPVAAPDLHAPAGVGSAPFRGAGDRPAPMLASSFSKPLLWGVIALLVGAVVLWRLPTLPIQLGAPQPGAPATGQDAAVTESAPGEVTESLSLNQAENVPLESASEATSITTSESVSASMVPPAALPASAASVTPGAPVPLASVPLAAASDAARNAAQAATGAVVFEATGETWVAVRDANGKVLINRTLQSGAKLGVSGDLPLSVTVGRKDAVAVTVHGKPFDIKSLSRSAVARFEVK